MWQPDEERLYLLDLGMVGEVDAEMREQMMLLMMAFWQEDVGFLTDVTLHARRARSTAATSTSTRSATRSARCWPGTAAPRSTRSTWARSCSR